MMKFSHLAALRPFIHLLSEYRQWLILGFILTVATLFFSVGLLSVSGWFLTGTSLSGGTSELTAIAYNFFQPAATVRGFAVGRTVGRWAERVVNHEITFKLLARYRTWLFTGLAPLSASQRNHYHGGTLLNRITKDIDALDNLYVRLLLPVSSALLLMCVISVVACFFLTSLMIPFSILIIAAFLVLPCCAWHLGKTTAPNSQAQQQQLRIELLELVDGLETLSLRQHAWQRYRQRALKQSANWLNSHWQLHKRATLLSHAQSALIGLMALLALALMSYSELEGIWIGGGTLLVLACGELLVMLPDAWLRLPGTCTSAQSLTNLHQTQPSMTYPSEMLKQPEGHELELQNVSFSYENCHILENINMIIPAGTHCLLQGSSGEGKTTLIQLLTRQTPQQKGQIRFGGVKISDFSENSLRQYIAIAPQDTYLFTNTIGYNLRLAAPKATDEELWEVLALVGLTDTVKKLPLGLDSWTDEGGANLSGGQRRRLGIARALLVNADWLLLDEPTEGLDIDSEIQLIQNITRHLKNKTILWVSHRSTASQYFDQILHLSQGRIEIKKLNHLSSN